MALWWERRFGKFTVFKIHHAASFILKRVSHLSISAFAAASHCPSGSRVDGSFRAARPRSRTSCLIASIAAFGVRREFVISADAHSRLTLAFIRRRSRFSCGSPLSRICRTARERPLVRGLLCKRRRGERGERDGESEDGARGGHGTPLQTFAPAGGGAGAPMSLPSRSTDSAIEFGSGLVLSTLPSTGRTTRKKAK